MLAVGVALIGSALAAAWDLRTTEIPDEIPHAMAVLGVVLAGLRTWLEQDWMPLADSGLAGLGLLGFGFLMYRLGQWGGGDAKVLAAIGFLTPTLPRPTLLLLPLPLAYLLNVFLVGAAYMLIYALVLALLDRHILTEFAHDVRASGRLLLVGVGTLFITFMAINWYLTSLFGLTPHVSSLLSNSLLPLAVSVGLLFVWKFARTVEMVGFRKKIPISQLRVGDVLEESRLWEGITERELEQIRRSGRKFVIIKEGVRFGPTFTLALLVTLYFGDGILLFLRYL